MSTLGNLDPALVEPARALLRALRRFRGSQGPRARRNATTAFRRSARALAEAVAEAFPVERRAGKVGRRLGPVQRVKKLRAAGWRPVPTNNAVLSVMAAARVPVKTVPVVAAGAPVPGKREAYAPGWAIDIATKYPSRLEAARRDLGLRRILVTKITLQGGLT